MRTLPALLLATAVAVLSLAPTARAGTYPMLQCRATAGREVSAGWTTYGPAISFDACGADDAFGVWLPEMPWGSVGGLTIGVPTALPHIAIARVDATMSVARERDQYAFLRWFAGGSILVDREMTGWAETLSRTAPDDARDFGMDVYCSFGVGPVNCHFDDLHRAVVISALTFTLAEYDEPTAQATGGSLLSGGARTGTESLTWTASDADSGVRSAVIKLGQRAVGTYDFSPACAYTDWNACPLSQTRTLDVDTTKVPDDTYPLRIEVADAAGNIRTVETGHTVVVANHPPAPPTAGGAGAGQPTAGGGGSAPSTAAVEGSATTDRGHHNGSGAASSAVFTAELVNHRQAMLVPYRRSAVTISGRLTQRDGTPIAGARLDVGSQTVVPGLPGPDSGQTITDEDGRWSVTTVPGPSREVTVAWRAFDRDRSYTETNRLSLLVRAGAALAAHPRRIANGGRVTLSGRLLGTPYPDGGVLVTLQGRPRHGGRWRTFGVTRSRPDGRFRYRYRFSRVAGGARMFLFRARVNRQDGYPYEAGVAGSAKASVRP
jgi:hypothetical protein